jgi:hypothetical protein
MIINCPKCKKEFEIDEPDHMIVPIFKACECGEKYALLMDCDDDYDAILTVDFYEFNEF